MGLKKETRLVPFPSPYISFSFHLIICPLFNVWLSPSVCLSFSFFLFFLCLHATERSSRRCLIGEELTSLLWIYSWTSPTLPFLCIRRPITLEATTSRSKVSSHGDLSGHDTHLLCSTSSEQLLFQLGP